MSFLRLMVVMLVTATAHALPLEHLTNLDGSPAKVEHVKNTELVVFWATWCSSCKEKLKGVLPEINRRGDVAVVTVNTEKDTERVRRFLAKEEIHLPVLLDPTRVLRKELKVFSVPHWAVYRRTAPGKPWSLVDSAPAFETERVEKALRGGNHAGR